MLVFAAIALVAAALFVRLGFWQLDRLSQRRERNTLLSERINAPPATWSETTAVRYRRVRLTGVPDYEREIVLVGRSRGGSPGVNLVTPLRLRGTDTAVLVNRGWVYSPDATAVDHARWREGDGDGDTLSVEGYVEAFTEPGPGDLPANQRIARRLSHQAVSARFPYPIAPAYVVGIDPTPPAGRQPSVSRDVPVRPGLPAPDEGPHFGYALQWFAFAVIAVVGAGIAIATGRRAVINHGADGVTGASFKGTTYGRDGSHSGPRT
jgi:surfeit locus 1 family protein